MLEAELPVGAMTELVVGLPAIEVVVSATVAAVVAGLEGPL